MKDQVIVALVDGMRPDGAFACGHPFFERLTRESLHCLDAQTITRPVTLPTHVSLFTGVDQHHHTVLDNIWHPYPEKYPGILETTHGAGKKTAMLITWDNLRLIGAPGSVDRFEYVRGDVPGRTVEEFMAFEESWTQRALEIIRSEEYDFLFFYFDNKLAVFKSFKSFFGFFNGETFKVRHFNFLCVEKTCHKLTA